jgi:hypothetical protein
LSGNNLGDQPKPFKLLLLNGLRKANLWLAVVGHPMAVAVTHFSGVSLGMLLHTDFSSM